MKAKIKQKTCRNCGAKFRPYNSLQVACSHTCAHILQKVHCKLKPPKEILGEVNSVKSRARLKEKLQQVVNEIIRVIDKDLPCISCGGTHLPQAGHFHSTGSHPYLRFNLNNIHVQDHHCNIELTGNKEEFFRGMGERYGYGYASMVDNIFPARFRDVKLSHAELSEALIKAKECLHEIKSRIIPIESNNERMKLRLIYNNRIGIYKTP